MPSGGRVDPDKHGRKACTSPDLESVEYFETYSWYFELRKHIPLESPEQL